MQILARASQAPAPLARIPQTPPEDYCPLCGSFSHDGYCGHCDRMTEELH